MVTVRGVCGGRRARLLGAVMLGAGAVGSFGAAGTADAQGRGFIAFASAQGVRAHYSVPDFLVVSDFMDSGGPVSQSVVDTTGRSTSFASLPYPGENAISAPAVVGVAIGQQIPLTYPFHVRAEHPTSPSSELEDPSGTYALQAAADQGQASSNAAMAIGGPEAPVSQTTALTTAAIDADGKVTVTAESLSGALSIGDGTLRIGNLRSRSVTTYGPDDAEPKSVTEFIVEGAKVGDTAVTFGPDGVALAGQPLPSPVAGPNPVTEALAQAGISVRMITGEPVEGGATGDTLEIRSKHGPPDGGPQGILVLRFGGATTAVTLGEAEELLPDVEYGPEDVPVDGGAAPVVPAPDQGGTTAGDAGADVSYDTGAAAVPVGGSASLDSSGFFPAPALGGPGSYGGAAGSTTEAFPATGAGAEAQVAAPPVTDFSQYQVGALTKGARGSVKLLFGLLAGAGALLLSTSALWRTKGVHATWITS